MGFIDFLYGTTVLKLGAVVCTIVVGGSLVTLLVIDRAWNRELRRDHNDIAGFLIAVVGVIFAILVSSLAITVLTRQDRAQTLVTEEAQTLEAMERETSFLAPPQREVLRRHVLDYLAAVVDGDWPEMRGGRWPTAADASRNRLWSDVAALPVDNFSQMLTAQGFRQQLDKLAEVRRSRSDLATSGVDRVVWAVVLLGSASTILFAILFGVRNFVAHMLMTGLLSFTVALAIIMIVAIDWPYFGDDSVAPERLSQLRAGLASGALPKE